MRQRVFAHYFGIETDAADAFSAAFRIPNFLQNLFGEGVLSASFIPVYARLLAEEDEEEAGHVAGAVVALLALAVTVLVLLGVLATPYCHRRDRAGVPRARRARSRLRWCGSCFRARGCWCSRRGAWGF